MFCAARNDLGFGKVQGETLSAPSVENMNHTQSHQELAQGQGFAPRPRGGRSMEKLIFDVGLNIGQDTAFYLSQGYRVVAVEADPALAQAARTKFSREIEAGRLELVNVGIAEKEGVFDFWICEDKPEFNSLHRHIAARDGYAHHCIQIPAQRFATVLERYGTPYFLKIDIEGNDMLCLEDLSSSLLPQYLSVESECPLDGRSATVEDGLRVLSKLHDLGYRKFKLIDQYTFCSFSVPFSLNYRLDTFSRKNLLKTSVPGTYRISQHLMAKPRLERRFGRRFPVGSSGVWGEDTPGKWISYSAAAEAYKYFREKHFQDSDARFHSFWCDWHAKL